MHMKRIRIWSAVLLLLLISGCFGGLPEGVKVAEVGRGDVSKVVTAVGTVEAASPVDVVFPVDATIAELRVKEGDYVCAGDVLASLDREGLAEQAARARAMYYMGAGVWDVTQSQFAGMQAVYRGIEYASQAYLEMREQVDMAVLNLYDLAPVLVPFLPPEQQEFVKSLLAEQRQDYLQAMAARPAPPAVSYPGYPSTAQAAKEAVMEATGYQYRRAEEALKNPYITAPVSGYVLFMPPSGAVSADLSGMLGGLTSLASSMGALGGMLGGDMGALLGGTMGGGELKAGSRIAAGRPVFQILDLQDMQVRAQVEEADIPRVQAGQEVEVFLDAYPDTVFTGRVVQVGIKAAQGSAGTTVFPVVVRLDRAEVPLRVGYNATVDIKVLSRERIISLPVTAVLQEDGASYVFVVEEGRARRREVKTGEKSEEWVEVVSGLVEGERVVIEGVGKVKEGQKLE